MLCKFKKLTNKKKTAEAIFLLFFCNILETLYKFSTCFKFNHSFFLQS